MTGPLILVRSHGPWVSAGPGRNDGQRFSAGPCDRTGKLLDWLMTRRPKGDDRPVAPPVPGALGLPADSARISGPGGG